MIVSNAVISPGSARMRVGNWLVQTMPESRCRRSIDCANQVHGANIVPADHIRTQVVPADGILMTRSDRAVGIRTADCLPLILILSTQALALHVSRASLARGLLDRVSDYIDPSDISGVTIGPHICEEHFTFEWEGKGIAHLRRRLPGTVSARHGMIHISLLLAVRHYLDTWHVPQKYIHRDSRCTYTDLPVYSYRRWLAAGKPGPLRELVTVVSPLPEIL